MVSQIITFMVKILLHYGWFLLHLCMVGITWVRYIGLRKGKVINNYNLFLKLLHGLVFVFILVSDI